jgi:MinD-like ATPase involved in chromosome partitioning or flagellar assembly
MALSWKRHFRHGAGVALLIGVVSQKGGVGKSTLCHLIAREYAAGSWNVKIADLDPSLPLLRGVVDVIVQLGWKR